MASPDLPTTYQVHTLKTWPEFFRPIWVGSKTFEIRLDDRGFHIGDLLQLEEYDPDTKTYSGRTLLRRVTYLSEWNQKPGYVVMGIAP